MSTPTLPLRDMAERHRGLTPALAEAYRPHHVTVYGVGETVDDVVGPMVNKQVVVQVLRHPNGGYTFRDIQFAE